jgi:hypothetical protein
MSRLALALSTAALAVALLGATPIGQAVSSALPRNSVGPLQIKRNAVGPQKIAPSAVQTSHVLDGSLLTTDFKQGQIPQGPKGDQGSPGISAREMVSASTPSNSTSLKQLRPNCPTGKQPLGGGGFINGALSGPTLAGSFPTVTGGWVVTAYEVVATNASWSLHVNVICAKVAP